MLGEKDSPKKSSASNSNNNINSKKKKKKRGGSKKRLSIEQTVAYKSVSEWVFLGQFANSSTAEVGDDFGIQWNHSKEKLVFEFHSHSNKSDGFLSPSKLVERANQNGVSSSNLTFVSARQGGIFTPSLLQIWSL